MVLPSANATTSKSRNVSWIEKRVLSMACPCIADLEGNTCMSSLTAATSRLWGSASSLTGDSLRFPSNLPHNRGEQAASANNMDEWINMDETTGRGRVLKVSGMMNFVRQLPLRYS